MTESAQQTKTPEFYKGATLPPFRRQAGLEAWNRYAAVNDEFVGIHMDAAIGQAAGYPGAIGMGNLIHSWLHAMVEEWLSGAGRLISLECRFRAPALQGDEVACGGTVQDREVRDDGSVELRLDLWADRQTGDRLVGAQAVVLLTA